MAQIKVKDVYLRVRTYDFCSRTVEAERIALAIAKLTTDKLAAAEAAYGVFAAADAPAAPPAAPPSPMVAGIITLVADSSSLEVRHPPLHTPLPSYSLAGASVKPAIISPVVVMREWCDVRWHQVENVEVVMCGGPHPSLAHPDSSKKKRPSHPDT